jgi:hypothetical protein
VEENAQHTNPNRLTARQQRLLLRAVVGSLVISAALAAPPAFAQTSPEVQDGKPPITEYPRGNTGQLAGVFSKALRLHADGLIGWEDTFEITFEAERAPDGSLRDPRVTSLAAVNERWPELMREVVSALSEGRLLAPLEDAGRLNLTFKLDPRAAHASVSFEAQSAERAAQLKRAYEGLLYIGGAAKKGRHEEALFRSAYVTANGKQLALTLEMPRERLGNLLRQTRAIP